MSINALVVEDNVMTTKLIINALKKASSAINTNIDCTCATNTEDAKRLLMGSCEFHMMILDNQFPEKPGTEAKDDEGLRLFREYKTSPHFKSRSIYCISSSSDDPQKFENEGFDDIVPKPLNSDKLSPLLERRFGRKRQST